MPKSYPLLEQAPAHDSPEFIDFLREHNVVVFEDSKWLVIENCKYHTPESKHYTAFCKDVNSFYVPMYLYYQLADGWEIKVKRVSDQSVQRWHVHFIE